jgi:hypothetical protein
VSDQNDDLHTEMVETFIEYIKWHERFEYLGSDEAGIKARIALHELRDMAFRRRREIQDKREERKLARKERKGKSKKLHKADGTFAKKSQ